MGRVPLASSLVDLSVFYKDYLQIWSQLAYLAGAAVNEVTN